MTTVILTDDGNLQIWRGEALVWEVPMETTALGYLAHRCGDAIHRRAVGLDVHKTAVRSRCNRTDDACNA